MQYLSCCSQFLAQVMANIKMIDTEGFGIHKMSVSQKERYLPMPDYDNSDSDIVMLTLSGTGIDENYSLLLENSDIDLATTLLLDKVQKGKASHTLQRGNKIPKVKEVY